MATTLLSHQARGIATGYVGKRKAAALLIALGPELSSTILKSLSEDDINDITNEIVKMRQVPSEVRDAILQETYEEAMTRQYITEGGSDYARDLLARALGTQKASEMLTRAAGSGRSMPFDFIRQTDLGQLVTVLEAEHPQTIALILAHLPAELSGRILSSLEFDLQSDIASRLAQMSRTAPEVVKE